MKVGMRVRMREGDEGGDAAKSKQSHLYNRI